eukprot:g3005.t1
MSLYDKRFTRSMEILEQQLKPKSRSKRILPSETDPGLNMTFPRIQPAREKEPILDRKNMTVPIRKEDAIDLSVTLPPPIIEPIPQKITIEPLKEEDDDAKEDIFQVLDRQRKEQKWRKFKTKLHLTNWVEDLILDRFSDYDQQLKLEKEE